MIGNIYESKQEQSLNLYFQIHGFSDERSKYLAYKKGKLVSFNEGDDLSFVVLNILEKLGFSVDEVGTYAYAGLIEKIVYMINDDINEKDIIGDLMHNYSDLYFSIAHDNDIGTKTFHDYIGVTCSNINYDNIDEDLNCNIFGDYNVTTYGIRAYMIANYICNSFSLFDKKSKTKVMKANS